MEFRDALKGAGLDPEKTAYALHKPGDPASRRVLSALAEHEPTLLNWYQSTHPKMQEATLAAHDMMASFIYKTEGEFVFCGMFRNDGHVPHTAAELDAQPHFQKLLPRLGSWTFAKEAEQKGTPGRRLFTLTPLPLLRNLIGRLVVSDPGGRNYMRLGAKTVLNVIEVTRTVDLSPPMPSWRKLTLTQSELAGLPRDWRIRLADWRGVYLIVDEKDGARYVGSAYGRENLLGRWRAHVAGDVGVTAKLRKRPTDRFRFSILERVSPDMVAEEVIRLERTWMDRLDTIRYGLNT